MVNAAVAYSLICVVVGIAMIAYSIYQRSRIRSSENWQPAMGAITKSEVVVQRSNDSTEFHLAVSYEYDVNGTHYSGTRIEFGQSRAYMRKKTAEAQLAAYPVKGPVVVYFDPNEPKQAVLVRKAPYTTLYLVVGILAAALGVFIIVRSSLGG